IGKRAAVNLLVGANCELPDISLVGNRRPQIFELIGLRIEAQNMALVISADIKPVIGSKFEGKSTALGVPPDLRLRDTGRKSHDVHAGKIKVNRVQPLCAVWP